jgi:hypothetical protein
MRTKLGGFDSRIRKMNSRKGGEGSPQFRELGVRFPIGLTVFSKLDELDHLVKGVVDPRGLGSIASLVNGHVGIVGD